MTARPPMSGPLIVLAVFAVAAGWGTEHYFSNIFVNSSPLEHSVIVLLLAICAFLAGTGGAFVLYNGKVSDPILIPAFRNKFYIDEFYAALIAGTQDLLARFSAWFDKWILDGVVVRGSSGAAWGLGFILRFFQFGNLQGYSFLFGAGVVALIYFLVFVK